MDAPSPEHGSGSPAPPGTAELVQYGIACLMLQAVGTGTILVASRSALIFLIGAGFWLGAFGAWVVFGIAYVLKSAWAGLGKELFYAGVFASLPASFVSLVLRAVEPAFDPLPVEPVISRGWTIFGSVLVAFSLVVLAWRGYLRGGRL